MEQPFISTDERTSSGTSLIAGLTFIGVLGVASDITALSIIPLSIAKFSRALTTPPPFVAFLNVGLEDLAPSTRTLYISSISSPKSKPTIAERLTSLKLPNFYNFSMKSRINYY